MEKRLLDVEVVFQHGLYFSVPSWFISVFCEICLSRLLLRYPRCHQGDGYNYGLFENVQLFHLGPIVVIFLKIFNNMVRMVSSTYAESETNYIFAYN